jgi:hypothetical protein
MRKVLILLALTFMTANSVGCCCCRGLRDWLFQGGSCCPLLSGTTYAAPATYAVAPTCAPACGPAYAPTYATPMAATGAPQYVMPQYTMAAPMANACGDPCSSSCSPCASSCSSCSGGCSACGAGYPTDMGGCSTCGTPVVGTAYVGEPSCSYSDGATPAPTAVYPSPAAE